MGKIIKLQVEELPALCVVGKQLKVDMQELQKENPIPDRHPLFGEFDRLLYIP
jgi:hypothetical protein